METISMAVNIAGIFIFLGLAALAATIIMLVGKAMFKRWFNWFLLFVIAIVGGIGGVIILIFGQRLEKVKADTTIGSISTLLIMVSSLLLIMMIVLPLMSMLLRQRRMRIRELETEIKSLKENKPTI